MTMKVIDYECLDWFSKVFVIEAGTSGGTYRTESSKT